jgi:hypothetical protein
MPSELNTRFAAHSSDSPESSATISPGVMKLKSL